MSVSVPRLSSCTDLLVILGAILLSWEMPTALAAGGYPQPEICDRSCWNARPPQGSLSYMSGLNRAVIHHSADPSDYETTSLEESKANVRAIQNLHMDVNGWADVGYHFLSDKLGYAFEGREGALTSYVRGAHDGVNDQSFGFNMMAYFHDPYNDQPTTEHRCIVYRLIAWRVPDPYTAFGSGTYGGKTVGFLAGHRDVAATACPGDLMYTPYITTDYAGAEARLEVNALITTGASALCGGGGPLAHPSPPTLHTAVNLGDGRSIRLEWSDVGEVAGYQVWIRKVSSGSSGALDLSADTLSFTHSNPAPGEAYAYKVTAVGTASTSAASDEYTAVADADPSSLLLVDGNDRWITQTAENPNGANHSFLVTVAQSISGLAFDSADNNAIESGALDLLDYDAVIWVLGEESTAQETFSAIEQERLSTYLAAGGKLLITGAEVGWDLEAKGSSADQSFYANQLHADYVGDDAGAYSAHAVSGGLFDGIGLIDFSPGVMNVDYPDYIDPLNGASLELVYSDASGAPSSRGAAIRFGDDAHLVYLAFPVEAILDAADRAQVLARVLEWFELGPAEGMRVSSVEVSQTGLGPRKKAVATVAVVDERGQAVPGALVTGIFSGGYSARVTAETDSSGVARLETSARVRGTSGFTFCIDDITHAALNYVPPADFDPCESI